jgi:hypothetical protein
LDQICRTAAVAAVPWSGACVPVGLSDSAKFISIGQHRIIEKCGRFDRPTAGAQTKAVCKQHIQHLRPLGTETLSSFVT